jgi:diguanylate cyclase (GGDEF)-like protein/PAS domain S-box-containing protein
VVPGRGFDRQFPDELCPSTSAPNGTRNALVSTAQLKNGDAMADRPLTIGVVSPLLAGAYFGEILKGVSSWVGRFGGRAIAVQTLDASLGDKYAGVPPFTSRVAWDHLDGLLVVVRATTDEFLAGVRSRGLPVVTVSHHVPRLHCPEVLPDNRSGMADAVRHLVEHGHTRIAFSGYTGLPDVAERYDGYLEAMRSHGLYVGPDLYFPAPNSCEDGGEEAARAMLDAGLPFSALVCATDLNALGTTRVLRDAGVEMPGRVALIGFDDMPFSAHLAPPLTTVRQNFDLLSETATRLLVQMISGNAVLSGAHRVRTSLIARGSCGCNQRPGMSLWPSVLSEAGAAQRFRSFLSARLHGPHLSPAQLQALTSATECLLAAYHGALDNGALGNGAPDQDVVDLRALGQSAEEVFRQSPRPETTNTLMEALVAYRRDLLALELTTRRMDILDVCEREVLRALRTAEARATASTIDSLQASLRNEYYVSMGLVGLRLGQGGLRDEGMRPLSLEWLEGTQARSACLGLWTSPGSRELRLVSFYGPRGPSAPAPGHVVPEEQFPPVDVLARQPDDVFFVLPVRTSEHDWGMLAVTGPAQTAAKTGRDAYFQWAALLGIALDHDAVVESLKRQREDLAEAYRRQRELVGEVTASEERYALAASAANDGLWDWDLVNGTVYYSPRWQAMLGYDEGEIGTSPSEWLDRAHPDDSLRLRKLVEECAGGRQSSLQTEHRIMAKDGSYRWALCRAATVSANGGRPVRMVGALTDITEQKLLENRLLQAALYDSLTGLPNRSLFMDRMAQAFGRAKRQPGHLFCVLFIDLDGFKVVNDTLGHLFGDLLLVKVAERITAHLRESDTAVRFGGDEFAVLLDGLTGPDHADMVARRLEETLGQPYEMEGKVAVVTATVGAAQSSAHYQDAEAIIREADAAMYRAKTAKRKLSRAPDSFASS